MFRQKLTITHSCNVSQIIQQKHNRTFTSPIHMVAKKITIKILFHQMMKIETRSLETNDPTHNEDKNQFDLV